MTPSVTQSDITTVLRSFILSLVPNGDAVFAGYIVGTTLTVVSMLEGVIAVGDAVIGPLVTPGTTVMALGTGTGGVGTYTVSTSQSVGSAAAPLTMSTGVAVVMAQENRVPEPAFPNFVIMTPLLLHRLSTNIDTFDSPAQTMAYLQPTQVTIQLDVHGPSSMDNAQLISTMFRDEYATSFFAAAGFDVAPFYADEPKQMPFVNDQSQVENRWVIDAVMQSNAAITLPQQSADVLTPTTIEVEATYPPA